MLARSYRKARSIATHAATITSENGTAVAIDAVCSAVNDPAPPTSSRTAAATPSSTAQYTRVAFGGSRSPPEHSTSMTKEPESEDVMKKKTITSNATTLVMVAHGMVLSSWNSEVLVSTAPSTSMSPKSRSRWMPESPKTVNHSDPITVGTSSTVVTNSRMVRPREIRAMNIPTNGAQLIHQPQ